MCVCACILNTQAIHIHKLFREINKNRRRQQVRRKLKKQYTERGEP